MAAIRYDIPDKLHRALKVQAAREGISLRELVIRLLREGITKTRPVGQFPLR